MKAIRSARRRFSCHAVRRRLAALRGAARRRAASRLPGRGLRWPLGPLALLLATLPLATPSPAQIPETFENLEILPADIPQRELVRMMRNMAGGLGVRCNHCHVGPDDLQGMDFATDEKEAKRVARVMMKMTREINDELLAKTGREDRIEVGCFTCHRGVQKPQPLVAVLFDAFEEGGIDAVTARYGELRSEYYGRAAYDFGEFTLPRLADRLALRKDDPAAAIAVLRLNLEHYPESGYSHYALGELLLMSGDKENARKSFEKAVEHSPDNPRARQRLESLQKEGDTEGSS